MSTPLNALPKVGAPATRALVAAGYSSLRDLAGASKEKLAALHGVGPRALRILEEELAANGLSFD
jgi:hypothetical protein